jgi:hypothetical protein
MYRILIVLAAIGCSERSPSQQAGAPGAGATPRGEPPPAPRRGPPEPTGKSYACTDLVPEPFRDTYRPEQAQSDRYGDCKFVSDIPADEVPSGFSVTCQQEVTVDNARESLPDSLDGQPPTALEGVGTVGYMVHFKPKSLLFLVVDEQLDCHISGILPPGSDAKALATGVLQALARRL